MQSLAETPSHLGGHQNMTWMDEPVLHYLIAQFWPVRSMLDIGCGSGGMVEYAERIGLSAFGIDGDPNAYESAIVHDYTTGPLRLVGSHDLTWCVEFVEHVEAQYQDNYLATFDAGRVLFLTAAYPGQGGHHHVNEQSERYWIDLLAGHGWQLDTEATQWVRKHGATPFARMTGMVFTKGQ